MELMKLSNCEFEWHGMDKEQPWVYGYKDGLPTMKRMFSPSVSCEFEISTPTISSDLQKIIETQYTNPSSQFYMVVGQVPKRPHKKRRIRKKWGKKYGYWDKIMCGDFNMLSVDLMGDVEFELHNIKYVVDRTVDAGQSHDYGWMIERQ